MRNSLSRAGKRSYWEKHIKEWKATGLSGVEYCRVNRIMIKSLRYWEKRIGEGSSTPALVELPLHNTSPVSILNPAPQLRVVVDRHLCIEIGKGFDPEVFEQVIRVLRRI